MAATTSTFAKRAVRILQECCLINIALFLAAKEWIDSKKLSLLLGPYNEAMLVASEASNTPYLTLSSPEVRTRKSPLNGVYMLPSEQMMHRSVIDIILGYNWRSVAVVYDNPKGK